MNSAGNPGRRHASVVVSWTLLMGEATRSRALVLNMKTHDAVDYLQDFGSCSYLLYENHAAPVT